MQPVQARLEQLELQHGARGSALDGGTDERGETGAVSASGPATGVRGSEARRRPRQLPRPAEGHATGRHERQDAVQPAVGVDEREADGRRPYSRCSARSHPEWW